MVLAMSRSVSLSIESAMGLLPGMLLAVRPQDVPRDEEPLLDLVVGALEAAILVLDDAVSLEARPVELREDRGPVHFAESRYSGDLPAHAHREDAALVEPVAVDHQVLGLEVEDVGAELLEEPAHVDHLEHEVRRVEVEPDRIAPQLQDSAPHARGRGDVVPARPLVVREQHRAVLERDLPAVVVRERDDLWPDEERLLPVLVLV